MIESSREVYNHLTQILDCQTNRQVYWDGALIVEEQDGILLRYSYPQEMDRLLHENGFETVHVYGDWDENELHAGSVSMVYVVKRSR
ncbi:hypothetical protein H9649_12415 [Sporosarcina sp. Sa2YVA2]|uniref:Methyltransferase n=1 Tax=Sporosarcina quadrami TaxID=2762234 RepID=A0ABR8UC55_9BACL|nr:hypothetical protein [Sporosarcina quadrami]MBD7985395.1 hypothetical protein [Sporosarcina quadrami]